MFFMVFSVLLNESLVDFLIGYMVGMVYMFFKIRFATKFNIDILKTPFFM